MHHRDCTNRVMCRLMSILSYQVPLTICYLHGTGKDEVDTVRQSLELASSQGQWLLLHNIHTNPELLSQLPSLLEQCPNRDSWRIWLTAFGESCLPTTILQSSCKVVLDSPKVSHGKHESCIMVLLFTTGDIPSLFCIVCAVECATQLLVDGRGSVLHQFQARMAAPPPQHCHVSCYCQIEGADLLPCMD